MNSIENLFLLMKERNITAKQLSDGTGISQGNISDWKSGKTKPKIEALLKLSAFFGVSIDFILNNPYIIPERAELTGEVEHIHCDNCSEEYLFHLKDNIHEFSMGLKSILECLSFAEEQGAVPPLSTEWWTSIESSFPDFSKKE